MGFIRNVGDIPVINVFNAGLISQKIALKELKEMSETTGMFTNITDEYIVIIIIASIQNLGED